MVSNGINSTNGTNCANGANGANGTNGSSTGSKELWRHSAPQSTQIYDFMKKSNEKYGLSLNDYNDLYQWSVSEPAQFWEHLWHYTTVRTHKFYDEVSYPESIHEESGFSYYYRY